MGKRLKELTQNNTKCMVEVNGVKLIDRMLHQLEKQNLSRVVIVVGYEGQKLIDYIEALGISTPIEYINNPIYDKTNNIYSLALAKDWLCKENTLLFESDIILADGIIEALISDPRETLAVVDKYESWMDGTCVKLAEDDSIIDFIPGKKFDFSEVESYYKTVNIYKFSKNFSATHYVPFLDAYQKALGVNEYYEQVLRVITMLDNPEIRAKRLTGQTWYEIDDIQDLNIAESLFAADEEQGLALIQRRYGGYWRYPQLLDYCYLVNPYFPPKKMVDEMKASFDKLLTQYPSGMEVNSLLAAKNFGVRKENILVGNGASELIKSLLSGFSGKLGIVRPTFEEYFHRFREEDIICFHSSEEGFRYSADDLIRFFTENRVDNLVLINPDNPSGNYIPQKDLIRLTEWAGKNNIQLVVDESFADFADEPDNTLIESSLLNENPHLFVMKSISKSYGIPGLRLGVLASGDVKEISRMKKDVAIWNINSFAEFFMQIYEKYRKDYVRALEKFRAERERFVSLLNEIDGLCAFPSQANYVMAEITNGMTSRFLTQKLLSENIFIKDLSGKIKSERQFIRIAVRNEQDNDRLIAALKMLMK